MSSCHEATLSTIINMRIVVFCCLVALAFAAANVETQENDEGLEVDTARSCIHGKCWAQCRRDGYKDGGYCNAKNACTCVDFHDNSVDVKVDNPRSCIHGKCWAQCRRDGYKDGGYCNAKNACTCVDFHDDSVDNSIDLQSSISDETGLEVDTPRPCIRIKCWLECRGESYENGYCNAKNECVCVNFNDDLLDKAI